MDRADTLLVFIGAGSNPIDPIRIMKGLFLFSQESDADKKLRYKFVPYSYGPCSFDIYGDLNTLVAQGLLDRLVSGARWPEYRVTPLGQNKAEEAKASAHATWKELAKYRRFVDERSFAALLREVYEKYPKYAKNSVFKE
jgi:hypothetical protein